MKKFYSIIAVASVMLTSVFGFSSCTNDDSDFNRATSQQPTLQTQQQSVKQDTYLYAVATAEQMNYLDVTYVVNVDGENKEISLSQMAKADESEYDSALQLIEAFDEEDKEPVKAYVYKYNLGAVGSAKVVGVKGNAYVDNADHDINIAQGYAIRYANEKLNRLDDSEIYKGINDIKDFAQNMIK